MFRAVRLNKASLEIISQIRELIFAGKLQPGDRLAPENSLLEQFGVSKQTLKEALRTLEYMGLLEIKKGVSGGAYVVEMDREVIREVLATFLFFKNPTIHNISEVRKVIEPYTARIAAEKATEKDLERISGFIFVYNNQIENYEIEDMKNDIEFHRGIAELTGNPILELIVDFIETIMVDLKKLIKPNLSFSDKVTKAHQRIFKALKEKDPDKASNEMLIHLIEVEESLAVMEEKIGLWKGLK